MVFGRRVQDKKLTFGVSGLLRGSNLIMWDHETHSWWQQGTFEAIVGEMAGTKLELIPSAIVSWGDFKRRHPQGSVLSRDTNPLYKDSGQYGANPYGGYDSSSRPFLFDGKIDGRLPTMERVVGVLVGKKAVAYPYRSLIKVGAVQQTIEDKEIAVFYKPGTNSALDREDISRSRDVGSAGVFVPQVKGKKLNFEALGGGRFKDRETGSTWDVFGWAVEGKLKGEQLPRFFHGDHFWFYWAHIHPDTEVYGN